MSDKRAVFQILLPIVAATALLVSSVTGLAQQEEQSANANERINFAGKLRMLSQRVAAAACNVNAGVDEDKGRQVMTLASAEFSKIIDGLEIGNSDLNIKGAETDTSVLSALQLVKEEWLSIDDAVQKLVSGNAITADKDLINQSNTSLLTAAQSLVDSVLQSYSKRASSNDAYAKAIDVAGRQRMLSQKISKEACQIWSGLDSDEQVKSLQATMRLFEDSLIELRDGSEELMRPPTERIALRLAKVWEGWLTIKPLLQQALDRHSTDRDTREKLFAELNQLLREMNFIVGFYTVAQQEKGNVEDDGAAERVNFSGKLRMLSQRVAVATCNYGAGVETDYSRSVLIESQAEFVKILQALEFGDADLRIAGEEKRRKTLQALADVHKEWDGIDAAITGLLASENIDGNLRLIIDHNMPLLSATKLLVSEISGQYSDPSVMTQSSALLVDVSGRQRMFTQKMSKEACLVWSGIGANSKSLADTANLFEVSLLALRDGFEAAGIRSAPTAEIMYGLEDVWQKWLTLKPGLELAVSGEPANLEQRGSLSKNLDTLVSDMNAIVGMYTIYGKTGL